MPSADFVNLWTDSATNSSDSVRSMNHIMFLVAVLVTTSKALVTSSDALVPNSFLLLEAHVFSHVMLTYVFSHVCVL